MTELEIIETLAGRLRGEYHIEDWGHSHIALVDRSDIVVKLWTSPSAFLFGDPAGYVTAGGRNAIRDRSFFSWLAYWAPFVKYNYEISRISQKILTAAPWLPSLAGCSSVEELELKMSVLGKL